MNPGWQRYLDLAAGLTEVTRKSAEAVVKRLVSSGEVASNRAEEYVEELLRASEDNRKALGSMVRAETERTITRLGLVRQADFDRLQARVDELESRLLGAAALPVGEDPMDATGTAGT